MARRPHIVCIGEILWDSLPAGLFPGGASWNVAWHLHALGRRPQIVSRVGEDVLGRELLRRIRRAGLSADLVQLDPELPTGLVEVTLDATGAPGYRIGEPAAWDRIRQTQENTQAASSASALIFGTLAQRSHETHQTVRSLAGPAALNVLDLNLRPPHGGPEIAESSLHLADLLKMNRDELELLKAWFGLPAGDRPAMARLAHRFGLQAVCVTCGGEGALLWHGDNWHVHGGYRAEVADTVGAGDAFLAAFTAGWLERLPPGELLDLSNRLGAFVAGRAGATPVYSLKALSGIRTLFPSDRKQGSR